MSSSEETPRPSHGDLRPENTNPPRPDPRSEIQKILLCAINVGIEMDILKRQNAAHDDHGVQIPGIYQGCFRTEDGRHVTLHGTRAELVEKLYHDLTGCYTFMDSLDYEIRLMKSEIQAWNMHMSPHDR